MARTSGISAARRVAKLLIPGRSWDPRAKHRAGAPPFQAYWSVAAELSVRAPEELEPAPSKEAPGPAQDTEDPEGAENAVTRGPGTLRKSAYD